MTNADSLSWHDVGSFPTVVFWSGYDMLSVEE